MMRDLVDRGRVMNDLFDAHPIGFNSDDIADAFKNAPTIDAVEVVRCKDCKRYRGTNYGFMVCGKFDVISCEDDFCVWGERKMDAEVNDDAELV